MIKFKARTAIVSISLIMIYINLIANDVEGKWNTKQENTIVSISLNENGVYEGIIVSSDNSKVKIGKVMLKEVSKASEGYKGKIFAIRRQTWYNCAIIPSGEALNITIKNGVFSKNVSWEKVTRNRNTNKDISQ